MWTAFTEYVKKVEDKYTHHWNSAVNSDVLEDDPNLPGYSDEYEEPNVKMEEKHFWPYNNPTRLRKNPMVPPCRSPKDCGSLEHFYEYKHWMAKEWAVYTQEILLLREDMEECFSRNHINDPVRTCGMIVHQYMGLITEKNFTKARAELWKGRRLVDEKGFVYNYHETKEGLEERLRADYDEAMKVKSGAYREALEKKARFGHKL